MNSLKLAGLLLIGGFALYLIAMFVAPRLYQEPDISKRVAIIAGNQTRWNVSQIFFGLGIIVPTIGFLLLTLHLQSSQRDWPLYLGAATFVLGAVAGALFIYRQTFDPATYWQMTGPIPLIVAYIVLTLAGLFFYGLAFLQGHFPNWPGYLMICSAVIFLVAFSALRGGGAFVLSVLIYVITLVDGIVLWRG